MVYTDTSDVGLGAVLEQDNHVIVYASRTLTKAEQNYSVIQKECLAIVYATKQFCHYLLGRQFQLHTDHAPLQWLSAQRMEGLLCRWALALQEYIFTIVYRKGALNAVRGVGRGVSLGSENPLQVQYITQSYTSDITNDINDQTFEARYIVLVYSYI